MKSYDALKKAIKGDAVDHAKTMGLHVRTLYKWMEPTVDFSDSGALNPLDRIETIISTATQLGQPIENAHAPIFFLAARFGGVYLPALPANDSLKDLQQHVCHAIKDFGDMVQSIGGALEPTSERGAAISANERREISLKGINLLQAIASLLNAVEMNTAL